MGLHPPTCCCAPTRETMTVTAGTAGQGDRCRSAPGTVPVTIPRHHLLGGSLGHRSPPNAVTPMGKATVSAAVGSVGPRGVGALAGVPSPSQPSLTGCPQRGHWGSPATLPVCAAGGRPVPSKRSGRREAAGLCGASGKTLQTGNKIPHPTPSPQIPSRWGKARGEPAATVPIARTGPQPPPLNRPPKTGRRGRGV